MVVTLTVKAAQHYARLAATGVASLKQSAVRRVAVAIVVNLENERSKKGASLDALTALVNDDLTLVNNAIVERMHSPVALIPQLAGHIIAAGGKRLRPMLTLAASKLCGHREQRHIRLAACVEFIHTATLLHDDVVDDSSLRRGLASANAVWGNKPSVLVGDFLFSRAFELMVEDGSLQVLAILSHASSVIAEGEVLQLITANDTSTSEDSYLEVIRAKTAALFAAACQIGAVVAERPKVEEEALESYGLNLGIAFQLIDDVLDYSAKQEKLGKALGDDFREGKITLPVILAFRRGDDEERSFWRRTLEDLEQKEDGADLRHALHLMEKHQSLADTVNRARHYGAIARDALGIFPDSPAKSALTDIIDFCIDRAF
jgi:octaprenyl-diphosphate synthase